MIKRLRLTRTAYAGAVVAYAILSVALIVFADALAEVPQARAIGTGLGAAFLVMSAARLVDAGFRYWRSLLCLALVLYVLPLGGILAYMFLAGLPTPGTDAELVFLGVSLIGVTGLQVLVAIFCLLFPTAAPDAPATTPDAGKAKDDLLDWTPPGYVPPSSRQGPGA